MIWYGLQHSKAFDHCKVSKVGVSSGSLTVPMYQQSSYDVGKWPFLQLP
jgi:hypothetical protein